MSDNEMATIGKSQLTDVPTLPPGNYWLHTPMGGKKKVIVAEDGTLLIFQESVYSYGEWRGDRWWQPPVGHNEWLFSHRDYEG